jgi:hypothetical protein
MDKQTYTNRNFKPFWIHSPLHATKADTLLIFIEQVENMVSV